MKSLTGLLQSWNVGAGVGGSDGEVLRGEALRPYLVRTARLSSVVLIKFLEFLQTEVEAALLKLCVYFKSFTMDKAVELIQ